MNQYQVKTGENIFDIAITLSGTIEGIWDLLVCNDWLTMDTTLEKGMVLDYHPEFVVNGDMVKWLKSNGVSVKNGHHYNEDMDISSFIYKSMIKRVDDLVGQEIADIRHDEIVSASAPSKSGLRTSTGFAVSKSDMTQGLSSDELGSSEFRVNITKDRVADRIPVSSDAVSNVLVNDAAQGFFNLTKINEVETTENEVEKNEQFFDSICQPKIIIDQYGTFCSIKVRMGENGFMAVDWGDNSGFQAYWGDGEETFVEHDYDDTGRHVVRVYGIMDIQDLDFSELNGVYYMISPVYVRGEFVGNSATNDITNQLLLTKESNE